LQARTGRNKRISNREARRRAKVATGRAPKNVFVRGPRVGSFPGRNDPCPCGSGKKYKKCCGPYVQERTLQQRVPKQVKTVGSSDGEAGGNG
jgi:hypothetical protein